MTTHSFKDSKGKQWTDCCECNRGGNGNDKDKCSAGFTITEWNSLGCFSGMAVIGEIKPKPKISRSKQRYQRYLEYGDMFNSFIDFCYWDGDKEKIRVGISKD